MVSNFFNRSISSLFLFIFFIILYLLKLNHFIFLLLFIGVYYELYKNKLSNQYFIIFSFLSYLFFLIYNEFFFQYFFLIDRYIFIFLILIVSFSFLKIRRFSKIVFLNLFIYTCFLLMTFFYKSNFNIFFLILILTSLNDIFAYILGSYFKGPKIIPTISPNKTWSGTISSYLISFSFLYFFNFNIFFCILIPASYFIGDIYFSNYKRILKIKDYSNLIKGHGGILDRLDSAFFSLSFSFLLLTINFLQFISWF